MAQRGRKSTAELATAKPADIKTARERPPAPEGMEADERILWHDTVQAMPLGWFKREHRAILTRYCQHQARADRYNRMASEIKPSEIGERIELEDLDRISRMAERETRAALALARSMRITHQAQLRAETAATRRDSESDDPKPWE